MAVGDTVLRLTGMGIPPYSARGLSQTLTPVPASQQLRRTINGTLVDFSSSQFRKFQSTISGDDQQPPALNAVWPGTELIVDCISELAYESSTGSPDRQEVAGSIRYEGIFTFYRPQLTMKVVNFSTNSDEFGAQISWSLDLEES